MAASREGSLPGSSCFQPGVATLRKCCSLRNGNRILQRVAPDTKMRTAAAGLLFLKNERLSMRHSTTPPQTTTLRKHVNSNRSVGRRPDRQTSPVRLLVNHLPPLLSNIRSLYCSQNAIFEQ